MDDANASSFGKIKLKKQTNKNHTKLANHVFPGFSNLEWGLCSFGQNVTLTVHLSV